MEILKSASKLAFLIMVSAVVGGLFMDKIDPKDFIILASMAFSFYFTKDKTYPQV
jgi:hypothetical protein